MQGLAERIRLRATLDELILPASSRQILDQIRLQARYRLVVYEDWQFRKRLSRGLGITALFSGESGTGKTMAAEAIANELGLDLYRIDLSAMVSKYIGETEKNIRKVFHAGGAGGTILFFDEADALFGKRTEVKDSHDRYANIEVDYLLQCMEDYEGIAILATNMKTALDDAFMRRLRFVVHFPFPSQPDRRRIWQQSFPGGIASGLTDQEWERLSGFRLTGGHITNIALNAAFLAAGAGEKNVRMENILQAVRSEWIKLELPLNESEFA
jgi:SpoVK/Ycf46/Vps4 family AAA+-type ATPase